MFKRHLLLLLWLLLLSACGLLLNACGQTGDLYLPTEQPTTEAVDQDQDKEQE